MHARVLNRRLLAGLALAAAVSTASAAGVSLAQGNGGASARSSTVASSPNPILAGVHEVLVRLVARGTINQQQADAIEQQADQGSIDPKQLVARGVLSDTQMQAVGAGIDLVKRAAER
jgi:hypothetical protein